MGFDDTGDVPQLGSITRVLGESFGLTPAFRTDFEARSVYVVAAHAVHIGVLGDFRHVGLVVGSFDDHLSQGVKTVRILATLEPAIDCENDGKGGREDAGIAESRERPKHSGEKSEEDCKRHEPKPAFSDHYSVFYHGSE